MNTLFYASVFELFFVADTPCLVASHFFFKVCFYVLWICFFIFFPLNFGMLLQTEAMWHLQKWQRLPYQYSHEDYVYSFLAVFLVFVSKYLE